MSKAMRRRLTETEVKFGFIYVDDDEFRDMIPGKTELKIITPANTYHLKFDGIRRLGWSKFMFKDNNFRPGDIIVLRKTNNTIEISKEK